MFLAVLSSSLGGSCSLLIAAASADWMLASQPASLTSLGWIQMAVFGGVCGALCGAGVAFVVGRLEGNSMRICLIAIALGLIVGAACSPFMIPIHLPVDLQLR